MLMGGATARAYGWLPKQTWRCSGSALVWTIAADAPTLQA
jgi:hypothetical protein